jgi:hypothetical protein
MPVNSIKYFMFSMIHFLTKRDNKLFVAVCLTEECSADRCSKVPCQHGGQCLTSGETAVCLCPLGFTGDLCETRVDLQVGGPLTLQ